MNWLLEASTRYVPSSLISENGGKGVNAVKEVCEVKLISEVVEDSLDPFSARRPGKGVPGGIRSEVQALRHSYLQNMIFTFFGKQIIDGFVR